MPHEILDLGPHQVAVTIEGAGAPVVCIHGSGMTAAVWRRLQARLAPTHQTFALDLPGYGKSTPCDPARPHHTRDDVAVVEAVVRRAASQGQAVDLVGHSYGALLALAVAYGGRVPLRSVVAYEPVTFGILHAAQDREGMDALAEGDPDGTRFTLRDDGLEGWMQRFLDFWNGAGFWQAMPDAAKAPYLATKEKVYAEVRSLLTETYDLKDYAGIQVPVLLLSGSLSPLPARRVCAVLGQVIPDARVVTIEGAGHVGHLTHAAVVNEAIAAFVDE